ncbi:unnamed protein product [Cyprideis torosa]|uniref:Oxysterol-binding protein n=1 Tax=Cyprideis torosa TaxID=163714 RepID=A0A7R8ZMT6_9CRUS|nr:unnamed protein product [Cyprideis torosa]CAG0885136.1 unnamed protein product [Cyprideis torosa]
MSRAHPPELKKFMDKRMNVKLNAGRQISGILRGYDPFMNIVLDEAQEITKENQRITIGSVVVRGSSISMLEAIDRMLSPSASVPSNMSSPAHSVQPERRSLTNGFSEDVKLRRQSVADKLSDESNETVGSSKQIYKAQRNTYQQEKKRVTKELITALHDPSVVVMADWLKVRGTLKGWSKFWCILKPGLLLLYKSSKAKKNHWIGTVLLTSCEVIERPSKKEGFCFKLFHPLEQSIWAPKGPDGETLGAVVQPLPHAYLIFRAPSQTEGKCWMDALELALRCSSLLKRSQNRRPPTVDFLDSSGGDEKSTGKANDDLLEPAAMPNGMDGSTLYFKEEEEEFAAEFVHAGPYLESRVVLPTFILEPRSFLDKLSDYYYHSDILAQTVSNDDPFLRMKGVVTWYLSGFYKKPRGLKKPYNPILGEAFRCYWQNPNGTKTFFVAEQVSHHPPVSAFYVTNRQDGYTVSATVLCKSKFYGNSTSAILDGMARLNFLPRGEEYTMTLPYAHCRGILLGTLSMELGGTVDINCETTGYSASIEFKLKSLFSGSSSLNGISGKIKFGKETVAVIQGHWDGQIRLWYTRSKDSEVIWEVGPSVLAKRIPRYIIPVEKQEPFESQRLWSSVSEAIRRGDQIVACEEKTKLEEDQRQGARERKETGAQWIPKLFEQDLILGEWHYRHADQRPWDPQNDRYQYEKEFVVQTQTRTKRPPPLFMKAGSISMQHLPPEVSDETNPVIPIQGVVQSHGMGGGASIPPSALPLETFQRDMRLRLNRLEQKLEALAKEMLLVLMILSLVQAIVLKWVLS